MTPRQILLRWAQKSRVPQSQDDPRREFGLPIGVGGNDGLHKREEAFGVVEDLDVDVELDMMVLGFH